MLQRSARPHTVISFTRFKRFPDRVQAGNKRAVGTEYIEYLCADPCHNVHIADNIFGVGKLDTDFGNIRAHRPHRKRNNIERTPFHAAFVQCAHRFFKFNGIRPVVCRTGIRFFL